MTMSDWTRNTRTAEASAEGTPGSDYRIREVEARLDRRVAALEAQRVRSGWASRLMGIGFVLTLAAVAIVLWARLPGDNGTWTVGSLSAEEVVLRDGEGIARALLATDAAGGARLSLTDGDGRERIRLTVLADGSPGITISDPDARPRAVLGYLPDGTTNLVFADAQGVSRAVLGLDADGSTQALFADQSGAIRALVGVGAEGAPSVSTFEGGTEEESP
jgi:hypothetical protein